MKLILASASPRRKELLTLLGYEFTVEAANVNEDIISGEMPIEYVSRVSLEKCKLISTKYINYVVISADTSVVLGNTILGKPTDIVDSKRMLELLSGKRHQVLTAYSIFDPKTQEIITEVVESLVVFKVLTQAEIDKYSMSGEGLDKAGGYGIQNSALSFISSIEGSPSNIIGFPLVEIKLSLDNVLCLP